MVAERLERSPPTKANHVQSSAGSSDFRKRESYLSIPLVGGFSRVSPISLTHSFRSRSILTSSTFIGSQDLAVKSRPNHFTSFQHAASHLFCLAVKCTLFLDSGVCVFANDACCGSSGGDDVWAASRVLMKPLAAVDQEVEQTRRTTASIDTALSRLLVTVCGRTLCLLPTYSATCFLPHSPPLPSNTCIGCSRINLYMTFLMDVFRQLASGQSVLVEVPRSNKPAKLDMYGIGSKVGLPAYDTEAWSWGEGGWWCKEGQATLWLENIAFIKTTCRWPCRNSARAMTLGLAQSPADILPRCYRQSSPRSLRTRLDHGHTRLAPSPCSLYCESLWQGQRRRVLRTTQDKHLGPFTAGERKNCGRKTMWGLHSGLVIS
ncbi:hypothetical protein PR048_028290 [Dryococelus australis]|uniref:Uncharacterized protein n=1 Tax=Dryococelus australis TaxID=614101 RepID=A0ABQ9GIU4_9NEOP|nr:hypothetical protein PR048_028290 [Dryococelus australis]